MMQKGLKSFFLWEELSLLVEHLNLRVGLIKMVTKRNNYKINVRSMQYSFFGKNQKTEDIEKKIDKEIKEIINTR